MSTQAPPPGGDQNRGPALIAVSWTLTSISLIAVGTRLFGRYKITRNPGWDDLWIAVALFFSTFYTAMCTAAALAGNGRHPYYLSAQQLSLALEINSIALIPAVMAFSTPKLAVTYLLIRLLNPNRWQRRIMYFLSISCMVFAALCAIFLFAQCTPPRSLWDPSVMKSCWSPSVLINWTIFTGSYSAFVDAYLAIYPVTVIYSLQINQNKKIGLSFVMGLGFVACIIAIYKCTKLPELGDHADYTYATMDLLIWTSVESNVIIIAASLPTLRPVFLVIMGQTDVMTGRSNLTDRKNQYRLSSVSKDSSKVTKEPFPTDSVDIVGTESVEQILPPSRIRRTMDVTVNYDQRKEGA